MSAVDYNKSRNYDAAVIQQIQRTVGATPDGKWGRRTIRQIRAWQGTQGLPTDGKVGPGTLKHFESLWAKDADDEGDEDLDDRSPDNAESDDGDDDDDGDDGDDGDDPPRALSPGTGFTYFDGDRDIASGDSGEHVYALQNDLYAFGFEPGRPDGKFAKGTAAALEAFQNAAATPDRIRAYARVKVPVTYTATTRGFVDAATRAEIRCWKAQGLRWHDPSEDFSERRIKVKNYAPLPRSSAHLVNIQAANPDKTKRLHRLAAEALAAMSREAEAAGHPKLGIQSAWRRHRWRSWAHYKSEMIKQYGSVSRGRRYKAYNSPHETGLAIDIGVGGLEARSKTAKKQRETPLYAWLVANAHLYGWRPYKREPWHWEFPISLRAWETGESDWRLRDDED